MAISNGSGSPALGRKLERRLGADDPGLGAIDGISVELDQAGHPPALNGGPEARAPDEELVQVERGPGRIELILGRLVVHHPVGLQISRQADAQTRGEHLWLCLGRLSPGRLELRVQRVDRLGPHLPIFDLLVAERLQVRPQLIDLARLLLLQRLAGLLLAGGRFSSRLGRGVVRRRLWS